MLLCSAFHQAEEETVRICGCRRERHCLAVGRMWFAGIAAESRLPPLQRRTNGKIWILLTEATDLLFVFFGKHRTGYIEQLSARAHESLGLRKCLALLLHALFQIARGQPPFGVGAPPPCSGSGAGGIDENAVEFFLKRREARCAVMNLHITRAGPLQPFDDRRKALAVGVEGVDLTLVVHAGSHGQRLAAAACAIIEDLITLMRAGEIGDDLRL